MVVLKQGYTEAGFNMMWPLITRVHEMQITIQVSMRRLDCELHITDPVCGFADR